MELTIEQWGEDLGIRIPKEVIDQLELQIGNQINLDLEILKQAKKNKNKLKLEEMVNAITPENLHKEIDFGRPIGNEVW